MEKAEDEKKERIMKEQRGLATIRILVYIIVLILIVLFFIG